MNTLTETEIAIHEAGHVVAHHRLNIDQGKVTIVPEGNMGGASSAHGVKDVYDARYAHDMVLAYCAGYAALVAAGLEENVALMGADDDFENAEELIESWGLSHSLAEYHALAVELMRKDENVHAVGVVADELIEHRTIQSDHLMMVLELADGECTEDEYKRGLVLLQSMVDAD